MGARAGRVLGALRRHWGFVLLLAAGIAMRVVVTLAYRPALFFYDSFRYLDMTHTGNPGENSPLGYSWLVLAPVLRVWPTTMAAPVANHVLGLLIAVGAYALLRRWEVRPWLAALATAPVLLDAYQLQIEQLIMSDTLFEALLLVALLLLARRRPGPVAAAVAGAVLSAAALTRLVGLGCGIVAVAYLLLVARGRLPRRIVAAAVLAVTFAAPIGLYAVYYHAWYGQYRLNPVDVATAYSRVAPFADCRGLRLPAYERPLCDPTPREKRAGPEFYHWGARSPGNVLKVPPGRTRDEIVRDFTWRVMRHQPGDYAWAVTRDVLRGFSWTKETPREGPRVTRWHFPARVYLETYDPSPWLVLYDDPPLTTDPQLAGFLVRYQQVVFLRGTVMGGCLLLGLLGALGVGHARRSGTRAACALIAALPGVTLVVAAMAEFSWRYELPAIVLFPVAGALGLDALLGRLGASGLGDGAGTPSPTLSRMSDQPQTAPVSRVLVTGGSGFVGRSVVRALLADHEVVNADLRPGGEHTAGATEVLGDLTDPAVRERAVAGVDAVVHLAAVTSVLKSVDDPAGTYALNVDATAALLELARENGVGTFVLASTNAVVGDVGRDTITEDHPLRPLTPYGATKAAGEMLLSAYTAAYAMTGCALRFSNVYGPGMDEKDSFVPRLMRAALTEQGVQVYGDGEQVRDLVHVDDTVQAVRLALAGKLTGTAIVGSGTSVSVNDLVAATRTVTGAAIPVEHVAAKPGEMPAVIVDVSRSRGQGYDPQHTLESGLTTVWDDFRAHAAKTAPSA